MAETAAIAAIGSKLKVLPPDLHTAWPTGLQYAVSADDVTWGAWTDLEFYDVVTVTYPGYYKLKTTAAANLRRRNYKTVAEADSIVGQTVVIGEVATA